ncbi:hypothetical protein LTR13_009995 [Exophiala sideris]|uniref:Uncharacterized protein n=1 Tax=Exophiala sideris TaxID=1016849 RepID=A0ABR0IZ79_9EURO|nr:hypothetical protein LTR13_009995 [Exophiala sideris]KAK5052315.1 hypothetical protein LTR69_009851 [Exophiala sideris]KAK5177343.1 hypothetical protein LTR44_010138 [Eurotiomycetes sp. CCFEE 6388]
MHAIQEHLVRHQVRDREMQANSNVKAAMAANIRSRERAPHLQNKNHRAFGSPPESHDGYVLARGSQGQPRSSSAMRSYDRQHDNQPPPSSRNLQSQSTQARSRDLPDDSTFGLSDLALEFARIPLAQFPACRRFIDSHRDILDTNQKELLAASVDAEKNGHPLFSRQCIQRLVIVRACRDPRSRERADHFDDLATAGSRGSRDFYRECQRIQEQVGALVKGSGRSPEAVGGSQTNTRMQGNEPSSEPVGESNTRGKGTDRYGASAYPASLPIRPSQSGYQASYQPSNQASYQSSYQPSNQAAYQPSYEQGFEAEKRYDIVPSAQPFGQGANYSSGRRDSVSHSTSFQRTTSQRYADDEDEDEFEPEGPQTSKLQHHGSLVSRRPQRHSSRGSQGGNYARRGPSPTLPTAHGGRDAEFRGQHQRQPEALDKSYKERRDVNKFFTRGRIFAMVWAESLGGQHGKTGAGADRHVTKGFAGAEFYINVRRMAVVRQREGYCICVPILTYGGQGVKENMPEGEKQAHAVIYEDGTAVPKSFPTEPVFEKRPIAALMHGGENLTPSSRVHFAKHHTVEHNVKVKDIGRISDRSMADFDAYWRRELLGQV